MTVSSGESGMRATITGDGCGGAVLGRSSGPTGLVDPCRGARRPVLAGSPVGRGAILIELPLHVQTMDEDPAL